MKRLLVAAVLGASLALTVSNASAQKSYDAGASDTEIKIGNTAPYSGPVSAAGLEGAMETAYFKMVNEKGGINGRKINFISLDDGYSPARTVEQVRRLVEQDRVLLITGMVGTPTSASVQKYLNGRKVPQLLVASGSPLWNQPKTMPWTTPFTLSADIEAAIYAKYLLKNKPDAKIAVLYQNDDFGKDFLKAFKSGLGNRASAMLVKEASYEVTDATIDSQIVGLKASGADTFLDISTPKFGAQSIRKVFDIGWKPLHFVTSGVTSTEGTLKPAGLDKSQGIVMAAVWKSPADPAWKDDAGMAEYLAFMSKYKPEADPSDVFAMIGYTIAGITSQILQRAGDKLTHENVMRQATTLADVSTPLILPGIRVRNTPADFTLFREVQLQRFEGTSWKRFGDVIKADE